jgi:hypothetical protein
LVAAVEWVTILTLGFTSVDKFSGKKNDEWKTGAFGLSV